MVYTLHKRIALYRKKNSGQDQPQDRLYKSGLSKKDLVIYNKCFSVERKQREKIMGWQMDVLMRYLAIHDQPMLRRALRARDQHKYANVRMRNHLRKTIGEKHWRKYLDFYSEFSRSGKRIKVKETEAHQPLPLPPFPTLSRALNYDVTVHVFSFLDERSMYEASKVSRAFRDAFIPRQRNVTLAGFHSFASFRQMNFLSMVYFTGGNNPVVTDDVIQTLSDRRSYPNLERIDCKTLGNVDEDVIAEYERNMGPRLEDFRDRIYEDMDDYINVTL